jgi:hypothetical protein
MRISFVGSDGILTLKTILWYGMVKTSMGFLMTEKFNAIIGYYD